MNTYIWGATFGPADFHLLPRIRDSGFDGIEVPILNPAAFDADAVGRELDRIGLSRTAVANVPGGSSLASSDADARQRAIGHVTACIHAARDLGAKILAGPMYTPVGFLTGQRRTADEWTWAVDSWQRLAGVVQAAGIEIALEPLNRFETYFVNTAADMARLCDEIGSPRVGILLDTFHANIEEKSIGTALRHAGAHLKHLHVCENDRGIPGSGHVAWTEFFDTVAELGYDRWMTIESFGFSLGELSTAAAVWRDLAPTPDAIAFEGVTFLRANASAPRT
ncbi:MAG: sugar phosphate isomerase/epimerase family protein [Vicinamibacteraceae bacterium]